MAQWLGQFTGRSHATRLEAAEFALRKAVEQFHVNSSDEHRKKVFRLAKVLLRIRLKFLKARIADAERIATGDVRAGHEKEIARRTHIEAATRIGGVNAILREFGVDEPPEAR